MALSRLLIGALAGTLAWAGIGVVLPLLPVPVRFLCAWLLFTLGPGLAAGVSLTRDLDPFRRAILLLAFGTAAAPVVIDVLGRAHLLATYPYVALALGGMGLAMWRRGEPIRDVRTSRSDAIACSVLVAVAVITGAIAFSHRLIATPGEILVYGNYDSLDLSYYAAITAEAAHTVPPTAPYYAGHGLNYAYYPQLVLAMVHRFADVPILPIYFGYAWPASLTLFALTAYVLIRSLASSGASCLAVLLMLVGGDLSYLAAWFLPHATYEWDYLLWPTNFLAPTMEVLHFNSWTPSLPIFFAALFAIVRGLETSRRGWTLAAALLLASLFQFKPFAWVVVLAALSTAAAFSRNDRRARFHFATTFGATIVCTLPHVYRLFSLYADRRSQLRIDWFLLPKRMLIKLDLTSTFANLSERLAPAEALQTPIFLALATAVFLLGGLGIRWFGIRGLWRALHGDQPTNTAAWRLLGWGALAGVGIPFVLVTEPYNDTLQFYQTGLYLLWIFTALALMGVVERRGPLLGGVLTALAVAVTLPSSVHYLALKWTDNQRAPLVQLGRPEIAIANYLRGLDPEQTVILHDRPVEPSLMSVVAERRVVLAWARYAVGGDERRRDVDAFYSSASGDAARAIDILRRYHVTHVVVRQAGDRVHPDVLARLRPLIRTDEVVLYGVPESLR